MKVLLVDDSRSMRKMQTKMLKALNISDIVEAGDGLEALEMLKSTNPPVNIMLLDWNMPKMDGMMLLTEVRTKPEYNDLKIIMCTSESEKHRVLEALKAGANNYISKPFTPQVLETKLKDMELI
jgi:two-component system chemotaxis response regulator CheY